MNLARSTRLNARLAHFESLEERYLMSACPGIETNVQVQAQQGAAVLSSTQTGEVAAQCHETIPPAANPDEPQRSALVDGRASDVILADLDSPFTPVEVGIGSSTNDGRRLDIEGPFTFADFLVLRENFGRSSGATRSAGDLNSDGAVNFADFLLLTANFEPLESNGDLSPSEETTALSTVPAEQGLVEPNDELSDESAMGSLSLPAVIALENHLLDIDIDGLVSLARLLFGEPVARPILEARDMALNALTRAEQFFQQDYQRGLQQLESGNIVGGLLTIGEAIFDVAVTTPLEVFGIAGAKLLSAYQTAFGTEDPGRPLSRAEFNLLQGVFQNGIDYSLIQIKQGPAGFFDTFPVDGATDRPFVLGNTIYVRNATITGHLLIHEVMHVWQHQTIGVRYLSESLKAQWFGDAYLWRKGLDEGKPWAELDPEQQAEMMADAWASGYFQDPGARFIVDGVDYTSDLLTALADVRS